MVPVLWRSSGTDAIRVLRSADIDGDRLLDLVAVRESGATMLFSGQGQGVYNADKMINAPETYAGCKAYDAHLHDFDRDGRLELIVSFAGEGGAFKIIVRGIQRCQAASQRFVLPYVQALWHVPW